MMARYNVLLVALLTGVLLAPDVLAQPSDVRVRILDGHSVEELKLTAHQPVTIFAGDPGNALVKIPADTEIRVTRRGDEVHASFGDESLFALTLGVQAADRKPVALRADGIPDRPGGRAYTGHLEISPEELTVSTLQVVNHVPLEDYVASVVASEYGFEDLEGSKAMAVLVRTYALRNKFGEAYDHVDHVMSQVYDGATAVTPVSYEATRATRGEVVTYADSLIEAVYFSASGGHTANNEDVWDSDPLPYLRARPDPSGENSPHQSWEARASRNALLSALSSHAGTTVSGFVLGDRTSEGRVRTIDLLTGNSRQSIRADVFRRIANEHVMNGDLKSTWFTARRSGNAYVFEGRGFGHGVGLSQYGARGLSEQGYQYTDILDYYFTDVTLAHVESLEMEIDLLETPTLADAPFDESIDVEAEDPDPEPEPEPDTRRRIGW